jgi:hypothetical protein
MMRRALVVAVIASSFGCKTDDARRAPPAPSPAPSVPAPKPEARGHELIDTLLLNEPKFANATALAPLKVVEEREQAVQSWCVSGSDAQVIAAAMASTLTKAGWGDVSSRGAADRAVVGATVDDVSVSITVGGRDATCTGLVATAHYTTSTLIIPPVEDGERIR